MRHDPTDRLTDADLTAFLDAMYPKGVAGADVMAEIAPDGWEQSPLVACFHPSIERVLEEQLQMYRNVAELGVLAPHAEPTLASLEATRQVHPIKPLEELKELVGLCLWDVFSDNHEVLDADGRCVDLGSFRSASAFLDGYISGHGDARRHDDYMRFYMGTSMICGRADLTPVYASMFRRMMAVGGTWIYHFPEFHIVEFGPPVDEGAASRLRADLAEANRRGRDEAMGRLPPAEARAYRQVYARDPRGWPPDRGSGHGR